MSWVQAVLDEGKGLARGSVNQDRAKVSASRAREGTGWLEYSWLGEAEEDYRVRSTDYGEMVGAWLRRALLG